MQIIKNLHPNMEKYRYMLEHQQEFAEIYNKNKKKYKYNKQFEEKRRYKESLKIKKELKKLKSNLKLNGSNFIPCIS
jgi:outer membrane usher protein FimD/PapC